ncbi:MAG: hypothetical protein ABSG69_07385 [Candidatus Acidiferrum sp.]
MAPRIWTRLTLAILLAPAFCVAIAYAQNPPAPSVADAAKQAREQKQNAASAAKVITDDDLDPKNVKPGEEGLTAPTPQLETQPPSPAVVAAVEAADARSEKSPADDPLKKTDSAKVAKLKAQLAQAEEDLKLSQRESQLEQDTVYSKPDYQHDTAGKDKLAELQQVISDKQALVDDLRKRLTDLQDALNQQGAAPPAAENPAAPAQPPPQP